ncbi:hypothetical protein [Streptomyces sp. NBC_00582]|uniref:hypothetical protein n=1 Tax=Streptomyces sp. NBC_00582 TaxID=2975783 RepID=UPI002E819363|nr:hypothetical protein [Streptomyces sp. NBC_00582]WUB58970.1 hypothetical protein OG852_00120 [Streptomyces sp. NBC_00582]WUB67757.1 hypothetical protein OG852_49015 [Streptomyces sp. NBC_00582]
MKRFVLVAGVDYERKGVDFKVFCENRVKRLVTANRTAEDLTFQIFDVKSGKIVTREFTHPGGRRIENVTTTTPFTPIIPAHYNRVVSGGEVDYEFKDGQRGMMSITDIYAAVRTIGSSDPGTLMELSFFSHAWHGGPILVNSFDDGFAEGPPAVPGGPPTRIAMGAARDPDDKDPRPDKDFAPPNMTAAELVLFQGAYHPDGYNWNWGCAFPRVIHEILYKLEHHAGYRPSGLPDAQTFVFRNLNTNHIDQLASRLGKTFPDPRRVELTFGELKRFFCLATLASYSHHLAVNSKRKTYAGLIGTYSEYDTGARPLMHIHTGFARHFRFYKNYLGFSFDPEGRKYGEYDPSFTC